MKTLGLRVTPKLVYFSVIDADDNGTFSILTNDKVVVPFALTVPERLRFIRNTFLSIVLEYAIERAGIKNAENTAQTVNHDRLYVEGVLQELIADCTIEKYFASNMAKLSGLLKIDRKIVKQMCAGEVCYAKIGEWGSFGQETRECILCAVAASEL